MLGQSHTPDEYGPFIMYQFGDFLQFSPVYAGALAGNIYIKIRYRFAHRLKADRLLFTELLIMPAVVDDNFCQGLDPEDVRSGFDLEVNRCVFNKIRFPRVGKNQVQIALFSAFSNLHPDDRVGKGRMRPHQKYRFGGFIVLQEGADGTESQLLS